MELSDIKGIGPKKLQILQQYGIKTLLDLLNFLPKKYIKIEDGFYTWEGKQWFAGWILIEKVSFLRFKKGLRVGGTVKKSENLKVELIFFNQPYLKKFFTEKKEIFIVGSYQIKGKHLSFITPRMFSTALVLPSLEPVYASIGGIGSKEITKYIKQILPNLSEEERKKWQSIHFPENEAELKQARETMILEELIAYFKKLYSIQKQNQISHFEKWESEWQEINNIKGKLPFLLSKSQENTLQELLKIKDDTFNA
jgi:ATP-dependent DNA helicase RecG